MLEATIGLNELEQSPSAPVLGEPDESGEEKPFTSQDVNFLRSLRISVEGESDEGDDEANG